MDNGEEQEEEEEGRDERVVGRERAEEEGKLCGDGVGESEKEERGKDFEEVNVPRNQNETTSGGGGGKAAKREELTRNENEFHPKTTSVTPPHPTPLTCKIKLAYTLSSVGQR